MQKERAADLGQVQGTCKWFDQRKGYGFATLEDGREAFIHLSSLKDGRTDLNDGEAITGRLMNGSRGLFLKDVYVSA